MSFTYTEKKEKSIEIAQAFRNLDVSNVANLLKWLYLPDTTQFKGVSPHLKKVDNIVVFEYNACSIGIERTEFFNYWVTYLENLVFKTERELMKCWEDLRNARGDKEINL